MKPPLPDRVLVVDDDENIRQVVRLCLADEGYSVFEAPNGLAALENLADYQPSLILLDLRMPVMDGWEFLRRYRLMPGPHVPIVAFVAGLRPEEEYADLGAASILPKPFDLEELVMVVRSQLSLS